MLCRVLTVISLLIEFAHPVSGDDVRRSAEPIAGHSVATAISVALSRADVAYARTLVRPNLLKEQFGEAHLSQHVRRAYLPRYSFHPITARLGRQGLDGLHVRLDSSGRPIQLVVSEAKYGFSRLNTTADGIQMGLRWRSIRLAKVARTYGQLASDVSAGRIQVQRQLVRPTNQRIQIPLKDGRAGVFWRAGPRDSWKFAGPASRLQEAGARMAQFGTYIEGAAAGRIQYESKVLRVRVVGNELQVSIKDAATLGIEAAGEADLPTEFRQNIELRGKKLASQRLAAGNEIARQLRKNMPHLTAEAVEFYALEFERECRTLESMLNPPTRSLRHQMAMSSLKAGAFWAVADIVLTAGLQFSDVGRVRIDTLLSQAGVTFGSISVGAYIGQEVTVAMMDSRVVQLLASRASGVLGRGSSALIARASGGLAGGAAAALFFAYGGYLAGLYDIETANRMTMVGVGGGAAGTIAGLAAWGLVSTLGTASTGTAISTLGGAAATNATLAWFGGGAIAAGGGGMAAGTVVLTVAGGIVVIAASAAVLYAFHIADQRADAERIGLTLRRLSKKTAHAERVLVRP